MRCCVLQVIWQICLLAVASRVLHIVSSTEPSVQTLPQFPGLAQVESYDAPCMRTMLFCAMVHHDNVHDYTSVLQLQCVDDRQPLPCHRSRLILLSHGRSSSSDAGCHLI